MGSYGKKLNKKTHARCVACGIINNENVILHHTSYYPEVKVSVHKSCHAKIHARTDYQNLLPDFRQTIRFYGYISHQLNANLDNRIPQFFAKVEKIEKYYKRHPEDITVRC